MIEFSGKKADGENWSETFPSCDKYEGYKTLLVRSRSMSGMDKIPTQDEYVNVIEGDTDPNKKTAKMSELNKLACKELILIINSSSSIGKLAWIGKECKEWRFSGREQQDCMGQART